MESGDVFADRNLIFVTPDGQEKLAAIQFGRPYMVEELSWHCDFEFRGCSSADTALE
jgi:hypothetical protein